MSNNYIIFRTLLSSIFFLSLLFLTGCENDDQGSPSLFFVKQGGTGNGTSWADASGDLQHILDISVPGGTVWVAAGTYWRGPGQSFGIKEGVNVYGGFLNYGNPTWLERNYKTHLTVLSGNGNRVIDYWNPPNSPAFLGLTRLDGFTIRLGYTTNGYGGEYPIYIPISL